MADFQNYAATPGTAVSITVPKYTISCQVTDSTTGAVLADYTGANALQFPSVLTGLSVAQYKQVMDVLAPMLVHIKSGL